MSPANCQRLWLIGGTQESAELAQAIARDGTVGCIISVTTDSARSLYPNAANLQVWVGRLNNQQLEEVWQQQQVSAVLDASHPYAVEISRNAISICQKLQIPYLRYERPALDTQQNERVIDVDSFATLLTGDYLTGARVLLTIGYKPLPLFQAWQTKATLFARILPSQIALQTALEAGFTSDRIICLRPPISADLERGLWQQWRINLIVSKASGSPGGEDIKRSVASQLDIPLVLINRPIVAYPQQTSDLAVALDFAIALARHSAPHRSDRSQIG
ncbi:cobalt-precorrin-6A reductase [Aliterella atlantica]|uniref:cobalt-precorrin-6A reductase n=1 Tax=Aliterella atlantica TaxID=1827278 RepID=UPI0005D3AA4B|nr:cobalt-precorrin-6A reductase [Aliterella atlantica]